MTTERRDAHKQPEAFRYFGTLDGYPSAQRSAQAERHRYTRPSAKARNDLDAAEDRWEREHSKPFTTANVIGILAIAWLVGVSAIATLQWMAGVFGG